MKQDVEFAVTRERDAWFVIRGYVYQVDMTIRRWLELQGDDVLELERGEDIDIIYQSSMSGANGSRLLEQVKNVEKNITLNSQESRAAVANYSEHRHNNAQGKVKFRFVTTAEAGTERDPSWPAELVGHENGIEGWNAVRTDLPDLHGNISALRTVAAIRRLLAAAKKPKSIPEQTWSRFQESIQRGKESKITDLIHGFEWSVGNENHTDLEQAVQQMLLDKAWAMTPEHALDQYRALFVYIFHLLSSRGEKRLTSSVRDHILQDPQISERDKGVVVNLIASVAKIQSDVKRLEHQLSADRSDADLKHRSMYAYIQELTRVQGFSAPALMFNPSVDLTPPPGVKIRTSRTKVVREILGRATNKSWISIHGTSGSGKTELALLIASSGAPNVLWISLRDTNVSEALMLLRAAFQVNPNSANFGPAGAGTLDGFFERCVEGTTLVIDDVPRASADEGLGRLLMHAVVCAKKHGIRIVTTSPYALDPRTVTRMEDDVLGVPAPAMSDEEVRELLREHSAPLAWQSSERVKELVDCTSGHPELVVTCIRHIQQEHWASEITLLNLLDVQIARRLVATVPTPDARRLLHRLAVSLRALNSEDIAAVASVAPALSSPLELLLELEGLWVQQTQTNRYLVCPLVRSMVSDLSSETLLKTHDVIARRILSGRIRPHEALLAIRHWLLAEDYGIAAATYYSALAKLGEVTTPVDDEGVLAFWAASPLPPQVDHGLKICVRTMQVQVLDRYGMSVAYAVNDVFQLAESAAFDKDGWALFSVVPIIHLLSEMDFRRGKELLVKMIVKQNEIRLPDGVDPDVVGEIDVVRFFWHLTICVRTADDVDEWLSGLRRISTVSKVNLSDPSDHYESGSVSLCDKVWLNEERLPLGKRDWSGAENLLSRVGSVGRELELELLWAAAERARIIVVAEYAGDLSRAITIAEDSLMQVTDPRSEFLIAECMGRQFSYVNRRDDAARYLQRAMTLNVSAFAVTQIYAGIELAKVLGTQDAVKGVALCKQALDTAQRSGVGSIALGKIAGECAVATWINGDLADSLSYLEMAMMLLQQGDLEHPEWKIFLVVLGHVTGYVSSVVVSGVAPGSLDGDEEDEYTSPFIGIFQTKNEKISNGYKSGSEAYVYYHMSQMSEALGAHDRAVYWATQALVVARNRCSNGDLPVPLDGLAYVLSPILVADWARRDDPMSMVEFAGERDVVAFAVDAVAFPVMLCLLRISVRDANLASKIVVQIVNYSGSEGRLGEDRSWQLFQTILKLIFVDVLTSEQIVGSVNAMQFESHNTLVGCVHLAVSPRGDRSHIEALGHQLAACMRFGIDRVAIRPLLRHCLLPFLLEHWLSVVQRTSFAFRSPALLRDMFVSDQELPPDRAIRALLRDVAWGLGFSLSNLGDDVASWLKSGSGQ